MHFELQPRGPFSLSLETSFFGGWASMSGDSDRVVMAMPVESAPGAWNSSAAVVMSQRDDGMIVGDVVGEDASTAWRQAQAALSLDFDGTGYPAVGDRDPAVGTLQREYGMLRPVCFHSPYEAAAAFVIGHRISMAQQRALRQRLAAEHGDALTVGGQTLHAFPRPEVLLELDSFGAIAGEKMERLRGIAEAALAGRLDRERLRSMDVEEAQQDLRALRGVGEFIAAGIVLRGAGMMDAVPRDDVTRQAVQYVYDLPAEPSYDDMLKRAEAWRPYRMWVSVLLHAHFRRTAPSPRPTGRGSRSPRR
ncbi:MAG: DNA-3-methyladenine glycosylase 2 family protein [Chloroflexi bacterium]|nr:DNA-3-methyladenine glycosylase 2 family protein [Chloroflexota bacterium]